MSVAWNLGSSRPIFASAESIAPLGVAGAGVLIATLGLNVAMVCIGAGLLALTPLLLLVPRFGEFMNATPEEAADFLTQHYPDAFDALTGR